MDKKKKLGEMTFERIIEENKGLTNRLTNFSLSFYAKGEGLSSVVGNNYSAQRAMKDERRQAVKFDGNFIQAMGRLNTKVDIDTQECLDILSKKQDSSNYPEIPVRFTTDSNTYEGSVFCGELSRNFGLWIDMRKIEAVEGVS